MPPGAGVSSTSESEQATIATDSATTAIAVGDGSDASTPADGRALASLSR